jgi:F-type H+-transporting ATPase subunit epsilon
MRLLVALPHEIESDLSVSKVGGEGIHGSFTLLPHHLDCVVILAPGILTYVGDDGGEEGFIAVDGGILTKVGDEVRVSTVVAVAGNRLEELERTVVRSFRRLDERERATRVALARIESRVLHELFEFEERV